MNKIHSPSLQRISRRGFLKLTAAGTGLVIGVNLTACNSKTPSHDTTDDKTGVFVPSIYIRITPENQVTIFITESEMGQGVWTSLPMLVSEELDLDWASIQVEHVPLAPDFGDQYTGGSDSLRSAWHPLRQAGAIAREMLISAAAIRWQVPESECYAKNGFIIHTPSDRQDSYGSLALEAASLPIPENVSLKTPRDFHLIGTSPLPLDGPAKVSGAAIFGSDVMMEGMLIATILHSPVFGGILNAFDDTRARAVKGVRDIVPIDSGLAIVADNFWATQKAREVLDITWDLGPNTKITTETIRKQYQKAIESPATIIKQQGEPLHTGGNHKKTLEVTYESPFQAHATMEPMCCTAHVRDNECDIWAPTQAPSEAQQVAARYRYSKAERILERLKGKLGKPIFEQIRVHTTFLGGGFGRRVEHDFIAEAVQIAKVIDRPVKLIWTRDEDIRHDFYRPYTYHRLSAILGDNGSPMSWVHRIVGPAKYISSGCVSGVSYSIPHFQQEFVEAKYPVPTGYWRSVSCSQANYASECFMDELAEAAGEDPYQYRRRLLATTPRMQAVMDLAAEKAGWGKMLPKGRFHGIAINHSHGSFVAQIVELSVDGHIRVHRVTCVIDCGQTVNPDMVRAQMEGSIVFGLCAAIKGAITIEGGHTVQSNFHDFPLLRMEEMPQIATYIIPSEKTPGGVGEPGVPPIAPAVANAVYAATGVRVRELPINSSDLM